MTPRISNTRWILLPIIGAMIAASFSVSHSLAAAPLPSEWPRSQQFTIAEHGLIKFALPMQTIDSARAGLEDLRIYDASGQEVPYALERSTAGSPATPPAKSVTVSLQESATVVVVETGVTQPLEAVTLETPADTFIKAVQLEGSKNNRSWQKLADGLPIFRQGGGVEQLKMTIPAGVWPFLRSTIDDRRSAPVPFTGARIHVTGEPAPTASVAVTLGERQENAGKTRLKLNLEAANLHLADIRIETPEPLFMRGVTVAAPIMSADAIQERALARGVLYRVAIEGQPVASNLSVTVEPQIPSRELVLIVQNHDNPPLPIAQVYAEYRPIHVVFFAKQPGVYHLLTGNTQCPPPRYDLASLGGSLKKARLVSVETSPPNDNPSYRAPEALPGIQEGGTALDVSAWRFRKPLQLADATAQQVEFDLDVLAHAQSGFQDVRLLRDGRQIPYILERISTTRTLTPQVTSSNDANQPTRSRWTIRLSHAGLPVTRLVCSSPTPLFARTLVLYENLIDDRGNKRRRALSEAAWTRTPASRKSEFVLEVNDRLQGDTLMLETDNGDNPAIGLDQFKIHLPVTRVLFKAKPDERVFLYYGNERANSPRYDLGLVGGQLLGAPKGTAALGAQEPLRNSSWRQTPGKGGPVFWSILGLVIVVLLVIISRLLPKPT